MNPRLSMSVSNMLTSTMQETLTNAGLHQVCHARTKHIDARFHFDREILDEGDIELLKIHTKENPTYMLTKVYRE